MANLVTDAGMPWHYGRNVPPVTEPGQRPRSPGRVATSTASAIILATRALCGVVAAKQAQHGTSLSFRCKVYPDVVPHLVSPSAVLWGCTRIRQPSASTNRLTIGAVGTRYVPLGDPVSRE